MQFTQTEKTKTPSPISKYLTWKGSAEDGMFTFYDKDLGSNINFDMDEFIVLRAGWDVQGWDEVANSKIWSNQVEKLGEEPIIVQNKNGAILNGLYKDIKDQIKAKGLNLFRAITVLHNGEIISFGLKGNNSWVFNGLLSGGKDREGKDMLQINWRQNKIKFYGFTDEKNGAVKYRAPKWTTGSEITPDEVEEATTSASLVSAYYNKRAVEQSVLEVSEDEDLPFN